jgi:hypothetical protein
MVIWKMLLFPLTDQTTLARIQVKNKMLSILNLITNKYLFLKLSIERIEFWISSHVNFEFRRKFRFANPLIMNKHCFARIKVVTEIRNKEWRLKLWARSINVDWRSLDATRTGDRTRAPSLTYERFSSISENIMRWVRLFSLLRRCMVVYFLGSLFLAGSPIILCSFRVIGLTYRMIRTNSFIMYISEQVS